MSPYIHTYLDVEAIDDLWSQIKQTGVTTEKIREVQKNINNKTTIGLGNFVKALFADLSTEFEAEIGTNNVETTILLPSLKFIMLEEILENVKKVETENYQYSNLEIGDFVRISTDKIELYPVPSQEDFLFVNMFFEIVDDNIKPLDVLKEVKDCTNALIFASHLDDVGIFEKGGTLNQLQKVFEKELSNLLQISEDDLTLGISALNYAVDDTTIDVFVSTILKRKFIRKTRATYMINNRVEIFGRILSKNKKKRELDDFSGPEFREHFGIECISIRIK
ncbi:MULTISPECIES: DUF6414 family protein [Flavobacteriaceae]|uniref:DUF6414 family protein n=1 Tax=Flavobacteriaceae TaxID=49546 RepID=UPI002349BE77|nr:hypothetical protein [Muricauda sp. SP22]MDC6361656.1 hypothetical protein [Muricauda sp. SP22]